MMQAVDLYRERMPFLESCFLGFKFQPVACEEEYAENNEGKESQHDGDGVGGFDLSFIELGKNV